MDDAWTPATTHVVIATPSGKRYWDDLATRTEPTAKPQRFLSETGYGRGDGRPYQDGARQLHEEPTNRAHPSGAPLLDWWEIPEMDDAWTPATTHVVIATPSGKRYWDDLATRVPVRPDRAEHNARYARSGGAYNVKGNSDRGDDGASEFGAHPSGAPLLDWWEIPDNESDDPMTTRYLVGDVFERLAEIPDGSVDLVVTSPPFLALRSYLPADHPLKAQEIGSEPTPAAFIDVMLAVTAELRRVLAPHGSIAVELGDSFAGSGGAGGDYTDNGWRDGQEKFGGSASRAKTRPAAWSIAQATWLAGVIDTEGYIGVRRQESQRTSPNFQAQVRVSMMDREVCDRAAEITGVGNVNQDGRGVYSWGVNGQQARYVLVNVWPYLLIKHRQAKAAIELQHHIEDKRRRGKYDPVADDDIAYRQMIREYVMGLNARGEDRGKFESTWEPPEPLRIHHSAVAMLDGWPMPKSKAMIPQLYEVALAYGINPLTGSPSPAGKWRVRNVVTWCRPNPPVGALGDKWRPATSDVVVACTSDKRYWDDLATRVPLADSPGNRYVRKVSTLDNERRPDGSQAVSDDNRITKDYDPAKSSGAPLLDYWVIPPKGYSGAHYAVYPQELVVPLVKAMVPQKVCRVCGEPSRRIVEMDRLGIDSHHIRPDNPSRGYEIGRMPSAPDHDPGRVTVGFTDCGHNDWRPGVVLDPFAGSGTTLAVAHGHGRDSIGIDLDERNVELAQGRLGMFLEVDDVAT